MRIGDLFLATAVIAAVATGGCQSKAERQASADANHVRAMVEHLEAVMADPGRTYSGGGDLASVRLLLGREEGIISLGKEGLRPEQRMADFKSSMALREYNIQLRKILTPEQFQRLHDLRVEYGYVKWVEDPA